MKRDDRPRKPRIVSQGGRAAICVSVLSRTRNQAVRERRHPGTGSPGIYQGDGTLARPNYQHEKRQKDIAKKKKAEEKKLRKAEKKNAPSDENGNPSPDGGESPS